MDKPIISNQSILPLFLSTYERYLPTAFDNSLSLLEKVNKVITTLNQIGEVSNDVVDQWNQVMEWVMADGLDASIDAKLDAMEADGTLAAIINEDIFNELNTRLTDVETKNTSQDTDISDLSAKVTGNIQQIGWLGVSVKSLGAKGDYISDSQKGTDDTTVFQNALNNGGIIFIPKGNYYITQNLMVKSNTRIIFSPDAVLHTYSDKAFNLGVGVSNVRIEQSTITNHYNGTSYAYYLSGDYSNGYGSTANNIVIEHGTPIGYTWAVYLFNARKVTISNVNTSTRNGIQYIGRSAEIVITNCNFVQYDETNMAGTKGFYSLADDAGNVPEGISIKNTLFYHHERNIHIKDLYVGKFEGLYLDGGPDACIENLIEYNIKTQFLTFSDTWALYKGFIFGPPGGYASPMEFRTIFNNTIFDACKTNGFDISTMCRSIDINNSTFYGIGDNQQIFCVCRNWNDYIRINGYTGRFTAGFIQVYGNTSGAQMIRCDNIANFDNLANDGVYNVIPFMFNGVQK